MQAIVQAVVQAVVQMGVQAAEPVEEVEEADDVVGHWPRPKLLLSLSRANSISSKIRQ